MKQTRQAVRTIKQPIFLDVYDTVPESQMLKFRSSTQLRGNLIGHDTYVLGPQLQTFLRSYFILSCSKIVRFLIFVTSDLAKNLFNSVPL
jgi:hypothetical protein